MALQTYGLLQVIHVVSPNLEEPGWSEQRGLQVLKECYRRIFMTFAPTGGSQLRLVPLAKGIGAGPLGGKVSTMTCDALVAAMQDMDRSWPGWARGAAIRLYVFPTHVSDFAKALNRGGRRLHDSDGGGMPVRTDLSAWMLVCIGPYKIDRAASMSLGIAVGEKTSWPQVGRGSVTITDGAGTAHQACAISTVVQLASAYFNVPVVGQVELARRVRAWARIDELGIVPIADAWWALMGDIRGLAVQPYMIVLAAEGCHVKGDMTQIIAGPGPWDGGYVAVVGSGGHFDPLWWPVPGGRSARIPRPAIQIPSGCGHMITDAGPAAAIMLAIQAAYVLKIPVPAGDWDARDVNVPSIGNWEPRIQDAMLRRSGCDGGGDLRWRENCLVAYARYPENGDDATLTVAPATSILRARLLVNPSECVHSWAWILIADDNWICLGRFHDQNEVARGLSLCAGPVATGGPGTL